MPVNFDFDDVQGLIADLRRASGKGFERELSRATADTRRRMETFARRDIQEQYTTLKVADISPRLYTFSSGPESYTLGSRGGPLSMRKFRPKAISGAGFQFTTDKTFQVRKAFVRLKRGERFNQSMKKPFFIRSGEPKRLMQHGRYAGTGIKREPIDKLFGPSVGDILGEDDRFERLANFHTNAMAKQIELRIDRILRK